MNKKIEVEIRALIKDIESIKQTVRDLGAKFIMSTIIHDVYFCNQSETKFENIEMNKVGSYSTRLRKTIIKNKGEKTTFNTKRITKHGDHNAWEEYEVEVSGFAEMINMLKTMHLKPFCQIEKKRYVYQLNEMEICIEDITDFGGAIEIEIMCEPGNEKQAKEKITHFLQRCRINRGDIVKKSITNIIMKKQAFRQNISL